MSTLIIKLDAAGDVARTTSLLHILDDVTWITNSWNLDILPPFIRSYSWDDRFQACYHAYDFVLNLEDSSDVALFLNSVRYNKVFGCFIGDSGISYTEDSAPWFDMGLISNHGRKEADRLKFANRKSYQEILFQCLGYNFNKDPYVISRGSESSLCGDVAISTTSGPTWKLKNWAYYDELAYSLRSEGLGVNILPIRPSVKEHISDIKNHSCLVSGDSLPMHIALGSNIRCVSLFICTSPWEIYGYGLQQQIISPSLDKFFYRRGCDKSASTSISLEDVKKCVLNIV